MPFSLPTDYRARRTEKRRRDRQACLSYQDASASEKTGQGGLHDQRGGGAVQAASADLAAVRARGAAEAVTLAGEHAAVHGSGSGTAGCDLNPGAGYGCKPGGNRNYSEHAREDDRDGAPDGGVRASGATGIVARGGVTPARESAAACDRAGDDTDTTAADAHILPGLKSGLSYGYLR